MFDTPKAERLSAKDVANLVGCHINTARKAMDKGLRLANGGTVKLESWKDIGARRYTTKKALDTFRYWLNRPVLKEEKEVNSMTGQREDWNKPDDGYV